MTKLFYYDIFLIENELLEQWKKHYWPQDSFVSRYPAVTLLITANIIWFILGLIRGFSASGATIDEALSMGAMWSVGVLQGNLFSLFSANFFHWDWQHLLFNMLGLFFLGPYIEDELGHFGFVSFVMWASWAPMLQGDGRTNARLYYKYI